MKRKTKIIDSNGDDAIGKHSRRRPSSAAPHHVFADAPRDAYAAVVRPPSAAVRSPGCNSPLAPTCVHRDGSPLRRRPASAATHHVFADAPRDAYAASPHSRRAGRRAATHRSGKRLGVVSVPPRRLEWRRVERRTAGGPEGEQGQVHRRRHHHERDGGRMTGMREGEAERPTMVRCGEVAGVFELRLLLLSLCFRSDREAVSDDPNCRVKNNFETKKRL